MDPAALKSHELGLQKVVTAAILAGLVFMLVPGTFLGVWNLIAISSAHSAAKIAPEWMQAHGHAQIFGWIGTFILGIGFYSLSKMAGGGPVPLRRAWAAISIWVVGVALRWVTNVYGWQWRVMLPFSAVLEAAAVVTFFVTVSGHKPDRAKARPGSRPIWMSLVVASTCGFLASVVINLVFAFRLALTGTSPAIPHGPDQRVLFLYAWGFLVLAIWGFNARWLPVFAGLRAPNGSLLVAALGLALAGIAASAAGSWFVAGAAVIAASTAAIFGLHVFEPSVAPPKVTGVHPTFPLFIRIAYVWLLIASALTLIAAAYDGAGGIWGASRHALTVGFISTMVFAIGQRVLPAFCGMRVLYSPMLMFLSLAVLNFGCTLRVAAEIAAYEGYVPALWPLLPASAVLEMAAVTVFAWNLGATLLQPPAHLRAEASERLARAQTHAASLQRRNG